jgi:hypothetical protein
MTTSTRKDANSTDTYTYTDTDTDTGEDTQNDKQRAGTHKHKVSGPRMNNFRSSCIEKCNGYEICCPFRESSSELAQQQEMTPKSERSPSSIHHRENPELAVLAFDKHDSLFFASVTLSDNEHFCFPTSIIV